MHKLLLILQLLLLIVCNPLYEVFFNSIDRDNVIEIRNWLNGGLNLNELGRENATPLMYSVIHDKINAFKYILFVGQADFSLRNNEGMSALDYAAKLGRKDMVSMLLQFGDDINKEFNGFSPLRYVCQESSIDHQQILKYFLEQEIILDEFISKFDLDEICSQIQSQIIKNTLEKQNSLKQDL